MHSKNLHMTITDIHYGYKVYSELQVTVTFTINNHIKLCVCIPLGNSMKLVEESECVRQIHACDNV